MNENDRRAFDDLVIKVQQHEATIVQLLEILAATNRKITEISAEQKEKDYFYSQV
ncbi:hypothetical protein ACFOUV_08580 [Oceanobacillus longus]|uniref:Uncharacterized protein n=1 Tax=Oceanobacillus longus TaxID=930120 RepID=A0ABV8GY30_9BACI